MEEWHEDYGAVLWHCFPIVEAPWCGTPLDSDWPGYHTHWQLLPKPPIEEMRVRESYLSFGSQAYMKGDGKWILTTSAK